MLPRTQATGDVVAKRLAALGRLWGKVKLFHPAIFNGEVDWDQSLVRAIPSVIAARTDPEFRHALGGMVAELKDPATRVLEITQRTPQDGAQASASPGPREPSVRKLENGAITITVHYYDSFGSDAGAFAAEFKKCVAEVSDAGVILFDIRRRDPVPIRPPVWDVGAYAVAYALMDALAPLLPGPVTLATTRRRMHWGYRDDAYPMASMYHSGFFTADAPIMEGGPRATPPPKLVFLVNARSVGLEVVGALQAAGLALVVADGELGGGMSGAERVELGLGVSAEVRSGEYVYPDGMIGFEADLAVSAPSTGARLADEGDDPPLSEAIRLLSDQSAVVRKPRSPGKLTLAAPRERGYEEMEAPSVEYRLLALFRFWNAIEHFSPYKHLLDRPWEGILEEMVPRFISAEDGKEYLLALSSLVAKTQDSHGAILGSLPEKLIGNSLPPFLLREVGGEPVVSHTAAKPADGPPEIEVGDVLLEIDGEPFAKVRDRTAGLVAASTPQAHSRKLMIRCLIGLPGSEVRLKLRDAKGNVKEAKAKRSLSSAEVRAVRSRSGPVFFKPRENIGYIDLDRLPLNEVEAAMAAVASTEALILDLRGYPMGTAPTLAARLTTGTPVATKFGHPVVFAADPEVGLSSTSLQRVPEPVAPRYEGRVIVLINEETQSHSEHTGLFLEAATDVVYVGGPTSGANGNITRVSLPGGVSAMFTGLWVVHGDGRQLQRVGLQPHVRLEPTLEGIRAGKDEILEATMDLIESGKLPPRNTVHGV